MGFPRIRPRRLRASAGIRRMVRETTLSAADLVMPLFVVPGSGVTQPIPSMPGNARYSPDTLLDPCRELFELGIPVLGICYGMQAVTHALGGRVAPSKTREYGLSQVTGLVSNDLLPPGGRLRIFISI